MRSLRYFFCVVLPPLAVLMTGRIASFFLSILLTLLGWIPGVIHSALVVNDYSEEQRVRAIAHEIEITFAVIHFLSSKCVQVCFAGFDSFKVLPSVSVWYITQSLHD